MTPAETDLMTAIVERTEKRGIDWRHGDYYDLEATMSDGRWFGVRLEPLLSLHLRGGHGLVTILPESTAPALSERFRAALKPIHDHYIAQEDSDYACELRSAHLSVRNHRS